MVSTRINKNYLVYFEPNSLHLHWFLFYVCGLLSFVVVLAKGDVDLYWWNYTGELRTLYRFTKIAVVGGSFLPGLAGHNVSEAAAAGCAVLTGKDMLFL